MGGGYSNKCLIAITVAWLLSLVSVLYARLAPASIFPWNSTSLPWHIEYIFQAMFYMALGYMFRNNMENEVDKHNTLKVRITALAGYLLLVFVPFFAEIEMSVVVDIMYQYITAIVGIYTLILIAKVVKANKYIKYVGQNTLIYFALHGKVYSTIQILMKKIALGFYEKVLSNTVFSSVFCLALSLALSVILIIPTYIINRWFPFIVGRKSIQIKKEKDKR